MCRKCETEFKDQCCCGALLSSVGRGEFTYDPVLNCFACYIKGQEYEETGKLSEQVLTYCPFCGAELPYLGDKYLEVIEEELGEDVLPETRWSPEDRKHLPEEFQTSEWWKKRRL